MRPSRSKLAIAKSLVLSAMSRIVCSARRRLVMSTNVSTAPSMWSSVVRYGNTRARYHWPDWLLTSRSIMRSDWNASVASSASRS